MFYVIFSDDKLSYVIAIAGHSYYMMVNTPSRTLSRSVSITAGDNITLSANMDWEGATGNISFYKVSQRLRPTNNNKRTILLTFENH
jgi:hypothetical protein